MRLKNLQVINVYKGRMTPLCHGSLTPDKSSQQEGSLLEFLRWWNSGWLADGTNKFSKTDEKKKKDIQNNTNFKVCSFCKVKKPATREFYHQNKSCQYNVATVCKKCILQKKRDKRKKKWIDLSRENIEKQWPEYHDK